MGKMHEYHAILGEQCRRPTSRALNPALQSSDRWLGVMRRASRSAEARVSARRSSVLRELKQKRWESQTA
jgi:hypothetical protein